MQVLDIKHFCLTIAVIPNSSLTVEFHPNQIQSDNSSSLITFWQVHYPLANSTFILLHCSPHIHNNFLHSK